VIPSSVVPATTIVQHQQLPAAIVQPPPTTIINSGYYPGGGGLLGRGGPGLGSALDTLLLHNILSPKGPSPSPSPNSAQCLAMLVPVAASQGTYPTTNPVERMLLMQTLLGGASSSKTTASASKQPTLSDCLKDPAALAMLMSTSSPYGRYYRGPGGGNFLGLGHGSSDLQNWLVLSHLAGLGQPSPSPSPQNPLATTLLAGLVAGGAQSDRELEMAQAASLAVPVSCVTCDSIVAELPSWMEDACSLDAFLLVLCLC